MEISGSMLLGFFPPHWSICVHEKILAFMPWLVSWLVCLLALGSEAASKQGWIEGFSNPQLFPRLISETLHRLVRSPERATTLPQKHPVRWRGELMVYLAFTWNQRLVQGTKMKIYEGFELDDTCADEWMNYQPWWVTCDSSSALISWNSISLCYFVD